MSTGQKIACALVFGSLAVGMVFNSYISGVWSPLVAVLAACIPIVMWARWGQKRASAWQIDNPRQITPQETLALFGGIKMFVAIVLAGTFLGIGTIVVEYALFGT